MVLTLKILFCVVVVLALYLFLRMRPPAHIPETAAPPLPSDFIWGVSSSAFQSEGGHVDSNWSRWNDSQPEQDRYGKAIDYRNRYRGDIELARELGVNTYRMGVNWARLEPRKGQVDPSELAYYDDQILAIKQAGMAPLLTLDHQVYPGWMLDQGGWVNPESVSDFVKYVQLIAERYRNDVRLWITFNEGVFLAPHEMNTRKLGWRDAARVRRHTIAAHRQAYDLIHRLVPDATVTSNVYWLGDRFGSGVLNGISDWMFLDQIADKVDVIGVDYYVADVPGAIRARDFWRWPLSSAGLYRTLKLLQKRFPGKPLLIAEVGMATKNGELREDGKTREDFLRDTIYWTQRARQDGINVVGYMVWSLTDNFEWGSYTPRFGLYTVHALADPELKRIPTAAVEAYRRAIREHGMGSDYRPVLAQ